VSLSTSGCSLSTHVLGQDSRLSNGSVTRFWCETSMPEAGDQGCNGSTAVLVSVGNARV
jgi:hypothetical protein